MKSLITAPSALAVLALATTTLAQPPSGEWRQNVDRFAERIIEIGLAPGLAVAVSQGEWVLHEAGFGVADASSGRRVTPNTDFYIASSSKALLATAIVLLADRGEVDLQAPITRYIPRLRLAEPLDAAWASPMPISTRPAATLRPPAI